MSDPEFKSLVGGPFRLPVHEGDPVRVYRSHHGLWSVQIKQRSGRGNAHAWYVAGHATSAVLVACAFKTYAQASAPSAYVLGTMVASPVFSPAPEGAIEIATTPRVRGFLDADQLGPGAFLLRPYAGARRVWLSTNGRIYAEDPHR